MGILYYIKFKSSSKHKAVFNSIMLYVVASIMTGFEFLKNLETNKSTDS